MGLNESTEAQSALASLYYAKGDRPLVTLPQATEGETMVMEARAHQYTLRAHIADALRAAWDRTPWRQKTLTNILLLERMTELMNDLSEMTDRYNERTREAALATEDLRAVRHQLAAAEDLNTRQSTSNAMMAKELQDVDSRYARSQDRVTELEAILDRAKVHVTATEAESTRQLALKDEANKALVERHSTLEATMFIIIDELTKRWGVPALRRAQMRIRRSVVKPGTPQHLAMLTMAIVASDRAERLARSSQDALEALDAALADGPTADEPELLDGPVEDPDDYPGQGALDKSSEAAYLAESGQQS